MSLTYQDLIDQYNAEIDKAEKNNQPEVVCEKLLVLADTYIELAFKSMENVNHSEAYSFFNDSYKQAAAFKEYCNQLRDTPVDKNLVERNTQNLCLSAAFANFSLGQYNVSTRNPGGAVGFFEQAKTDFEELAKVAGKIIWNIFSKYCAAFKTYSEGLEDFYRASFGNAKIKLQRAMIALGNLIEKEVPSLKDEFPGDDQFYENSLSRFKSDYQAIRSYYYLSDAKQQFNNRNFKNAAKQFASVAKEFDLSIKNYGNAVSEPIKNITLGELHHYAGWQLLAEAEACREEEKWQDSIDRYEQVRSEWEQASNYYLLSGLPIGVTLQEIISNTSLTLDSYQRVCENEKALKEKIWELENEIEELNRTLVNAIKPMGVTVNTTQEVVTTVEQNAQLIQNIENNAREGVKEILQALKDSGLDETTKKELEKKGTDILNANEKGPKFLDKVKSFTKDLAEIVNNVGDIAKPLIPGLKLLSLLI